MKSGRTVTRCQNRPHGSSGSGRSAVAAASAGDTVLLAGKGHESYQIVGSERTHFDDREEARAAIAALGGGR